MAPEGRTSLRLSAAAERLRESLAAACGAGLVAGLVLGLGLGMVEGPRMVLAEPDRQFTFLTTLLPAVMTVVGVVLSIMVVAQQLASQQYSPRAIRTTLRDTPTRIALGGLFAYVGYMIGAIAVFGPDATSPLSVPVAMFLSVGALGLVAFLIQHITDGFRSDRLVARIGRDTMASVERIAERDDEAEQVQAGIKGLEEVPDHATVLRAPRSGYLQDVIIGPLANELDGLGVRLRIAVDMGAFIGACTTLGWYWAADGRSHAAHDEVQRVVDEHLRVGVTPTTEREVGSDIQQLVDVALKALSPGINDPETAVQAINILTRVLQQLAERRQDWLVGVVGTMVVLTIPRPLVWDFLDDVVSQVRRVAGRYPTVLAALVMLLRAVAATRPDDADRVVPHLEALLAEAGRADLLAVDRQSVQRRVDAARRELGLDDPSQVDDHEPPRGVARQPPRQRPDS